MEGPFTKDLTARFKTLRQTAEERRKQTREKVTNRFDLISFSAESSSGKEAGAGWFGLKKSGTAALAHTVQVPASEVTAAKFCKQCKKVFGFFATKKVCSLCGRVTCPECCVRQPLRPPVPGEIDACRRCASIIRFAAFKSQWKQKLAEVKQEGIGVWYDTIMALKMAIGRSFPNFKGLVFSLTSVLGPELGIDGNDASAAIPPGNIPLSIPPETLFELQETALKELDLLKRNFDQIEKRIERVKALPEGTRSEVLLKNSLKQVLGTFLQNHLPEFRLLSKQFLSTINNPRVKQTIQEWQVKKSQQEEEEERRRAELRDREKYYEMQNKNLERDGFVQQPIVVRNAAGSSATVSISTGDPSAVGRPSGPVAHTRSESFTDKIINFFSEEMSSNSVLGQISKDRVSISLVHPALCPIDGRIELSIRGTAFKAGIKVRIGHIDVPPAYVTFVNPTELRVIAPAMPHEGTYALHLKNPDGTSADLDDVLFFTEDPAIIESFEGSRKTSPIASPTVSISVSSSTSTTPGSYSPISSGASTPRNYQQLPSAPAAPAQSSWLDRESMSIEDVVAEANTQVTLASAKFKLQRSSSPSVSADNDIPDFNQMSTPELTFVTDPTDTTFRSGAFGQPAKPSQFSRTVNASPAPQLGGSVDIQQSGGRLKSNIVLPNQPGPGTGSSPQVSVGRTWGTKKP